MNISDSISVAMNRTMMLHIHVRVIWSVKKLVFLILITTILLSYMCTATSLNNPHYKNHNCQQNTSYNSGSVFEANLNHTLFTHFPTESIFFGFSNFTTGTGAGQVNALFYCKQDVGVVTCHQCVDEAARKIAAACKFWIEGIVWFEECTLSYANRIILSIDEEDPYPLHPYGHIFESTMDGLVQQAAYSKRFFQGFRIKQVNLLRDFHIAIKVLILIVVVILAAIGSLLLYRRCSQERVSCRSRSKRPDSEDSAPLPKFAYSEVERMTNGFKKILGKGPCGVVYYGHLSDSSKVAVKLLNKLDALTEFSIEMDVFKKIRHNNIVSLLGYCEDRTNLALVWEFMTKGDLKDLLTGIPPPGGDYSDDKLNAPLHLLLSSYSLTWKERLQIAIDTAEGLCYLHEHCDPPILHRDVNPRNILLNEQLQAKVADYAYSKICPTGIRSVDTRVMGTTGYVAPEYNLYGQYNYKADVYSFGVVLIQLITGQAPSFGFKYPQLFQDKFKSKDIDIILDLRVSRDVNHKSVWEAAKVAISCVNRDTTQRPKMSKIVTKLKQSLDMELKK